MRPARVFGALLLLAGTVACATSGSTAVEEMRLFPRADLAAAVLAVLDVVADIDAKVVTATTDEGAGHGRLLVLHEWRAPRPESAVLRIELTRAEEAVRVTVTAQALGTVLERTQSAAPEGGSEVLPPGACAPCEDHLGRRDLTGRGNARMLADLRRARRAFFEAWDRRLR